MEGSKNVPQTSVVRIAVAGQDFEQVLGHVPGALLDEFVVVGLGLVALRIVVAEQGPDDAHKVRHACLRGRSSAACVCGSGQRGGNAVTLLVSGQGGQGTWQREAWKKSKKGGEIPSSRRNTTLLTVLIFYLLGGSCFFSFSFLIRITDLCCVFQPLFLRALFKILVLCACCLHAIILF